MIPVLAPDEMAAVDAAAPWPVDVLVGRAGAAVARTALDMLGGGYGRRVVVIAGKGNNGADGRAAAARLADRGVRVDVVSPSVASVPGPADLVIDAAFGTGLARPYKPPSVPSSSPVLAVDIPSGLSGVTGLGCALPAERTVTFAALKPGLLIGDGRTTSGLVSVADIGLGSLAAASARAWLVEDSDVSLVPPRPLEAHKWQTAVAVVAGSPGMTGAPWLVSRAALRAGAGYVRLGIPGADLAHGQGLPPGEIVGVPLPMTGWASDVLTSAERVRALVVGPGLGRQPVSEVAQLVTGAPVPVVVDADGINAFSSVADLAAAVSSRSEPTVITPHAGEFARLTGAPPGEDRLAAVRSVAAETGAVVLLKGSTTVVASPDGGVLLVTAGSPRLATAGTGDVLSGVIGALLARGVHGATAAALGAHIHGRAALLGRAEGLIASDLPELVAEWLSAFEAGKPGAPGGPAPEAPRAGYREPDAWRSALKPALRPAWAEVDLDAIRHNASLLATWVAPSKLSAVVKAGGYGHGAAEVSRAALEGGATWLAVALVEEGMEIRGAGIDAPVLLLSEPPTDAMASAVAARLTPTVYTHSGLLAAGAATTSSLSFHVKVDTGMHRVGAAPPSAVALCRAVTEHSSLRLEGLWTHLAVADEVEDPYTAGQLKVFGEVVEALGSAGIRPPLLHAANSAGAMWHPTSRYDMVRCGIALYGLSPAVPPSGDGVPRTPADQLRPAMSVKARVSYTKPVAAGERISYGLRYTVPQDTVIATVPLGYADGITRSLGATGGQVLVGGQRRPIAGTVTMDQILVDCGPGSPVRAGDEVVLLGRQGDAYVGAWEWAARSGTIAYEVVCGISGRVPRQYVPS